MVNEQKVTELLMQAFALNKVAQELFDEMEEKQAYKSMCRDCENAKPTNELTF